MIWFGVTLRTVTVQIRRRDSTVREQMTDLSRFLEESEIKSFLKGFNMYDTERPNMGL